MSSAAYFATCEHFFLNSRLLKKNDFPLLQNAPLQKSSITKQQQDLEELPDWMKSYLKFHRNSLIETPEGFRLKNDSKYLLYQCLKECGGAGDRVNGIITALYLAICTNRTLLIDAVNPYPLENYFNPNLIRWNAEPQTPASLDVIMKNNFEHPLHSDPSQLDPGHVGINIFSNQWEPRRVESGSCIKDFWNRSSSTASRHQPLWHHFFHMLFKFSPAVTERSYNQKLRAGLSSITDPYIGVHIPTGDYAFGPGLGDVRHGDSNETLQQFLNCSYKLQMRLEQCLNFHPKIFVASDSKTAKLRMHEADPENVKTYNDIQIFHVDITTSYSHPTPEEQYVDFWGELKILVDAHCLVTSRSGISEIAERVRKDPPCAVRFDMCDEENVRNALNSVNCSPL